MNVYMLEIEVVLAKLKIDDVLLVLATGVEEVDKSTTDLLNETVVAQV